MEKIFTYTFFAASETYNCNAYGEGAFGVCGESTTTTTPTTTTTTSAGLANTGVNVMIPLAIGAAMIVAAIIIGVRMAIQRRRSSSPV